MQFINREIELNNLKERWKRGSAEFFIIYGRRRVGKTELIKQFIADKPSVYFMADKRSQKDQLIELGRLFGKQFNDDLLFKNGFNEWLEVFQYLKKNVKDNFVFAVDEYPYLTELDSAISSIFQKGWDEYLKDSKVFLILSGSSISMMESETLSQRSPLFGRRTGQALIKPLSFKQSFQFFKEKSFEDFLKVYTICGGMPAYLLEIDKELSFKENITNNIFNKTSFLYNEIKFILKEEFREPKNYLSILKAIALSKTKFGEIANNTGLSKNILTKYLDTLINLKLIEKEVAVTEGDLQKSKKGVYRIADNFFRFWFQYVFPYKSDLEIQRYEEALRSVEESFEQIESFVYEDVCRELLADFREKIFNFERISRWWNKKEEIDVVGLNNKTKQIIFGECKWSKNLVDVDVYYNLKRKASQVDWNNESRKEYYILFSKSGFTKRMIELAKNEKVFLVEKGELVM